MQLSTDKASFTTKLFSFCIDFCSGNFQDHVFICNRQTLSFASSLHYMQHILQTTTTNMNTVLIFLFRVINEH